MKDQITIKQLCQGLPRIYVRFYYVRLTTLIFLNPIRDGARQKKVGLLIPGIFNA